MAKLLKLRRGTTTQHASFTGAEGEVTIDTTKDTAVVHDGAQAGGRPLAREDMSNVSSASIAGRLGTDSISVDKIAAGTLPNDVKVNSNNIINQQIINEDVSASAGIAGTKISPDFGTQDVVTTGNIDLSDSTGTGNNRIKIGTGDDLQIYHDGNFSRIVDGGTGDLVVHSNTIAFRDAGDSENLARFHENGSNELYYDDSKKLETTSSGISVTGHINLPDQTTGVGKLKLGDGNDLTLYHDGTDNFIDSTGRLYIKASTFVDIRGSNNETMIKATPDGAVELYHDNSKKLETTSGGITVTGKIFADSLDMGDNEQVLLGASDDLKVYHSGSHGVIDNTTGELQILTDGIMRLNASEYKFNNAANSEKIANFFEDGACELYYDHSKKFETTSSGVTVTGDSSTGSIVSGDLRLKKAGEGTTRIQWRGDEQDIKFNDDYKAVFGGSADLQIYHDGSNSYLYQDGTGELKVNTATFRVMNKNGNETQIYATENGKVILYYDNTNRVETTSSGATVSGTLTVTSGNYSYITMGDNDHGQRQIHNNSNQIGFLQQSGTWGAYCDDGGNWTAAGNVTAYSDSRLKTDISTINDALGIVGKLRGVSYKWLRDGSDGIGVIAQEVEEVIPSVVVTNKVEGLDGMEEVKSVDYGKIVGVLINAINELKAEVDELKGGK